MDGDLLVEGFLCLVALGVVAFQALRAHTRWYGAQTERLRMRSTAYYAAAHRAMGNPDLDVASLELVSKVADTVGSNGPAWSWVMASLDRRPARGHRPMTPGLARDLAESSLAGLMYLAEVRPFAGWFLRRRVAKLAKTTDDAGFVEALRSWAVAAVPAS